MLGPATQFVAALPDDTRQAIVAGLVLGVLICVTLVAFPGEPFDFEFSDGNREELSKYKAACAEAEAKGLAPPEPPKARPAEAVAAAEPPEKPLVIDREKLDAKAKKAERMFGIPAASYVEAVEQATAETNAGLGPSEQEMADSLGGSTGMALIPFVALVAVAVAYFTSDKKALPAAAGPLAFLARLFPREARVLGFVPLARPS